MKAPFHLAFPVNNLTVTKMFYNEVLDCPIGRSAENWIDFDFFGNQISADESSNMEQDFETSIVNEKHVPLRHFGAILDIDLWKNLSEKLKVAGVEFILEPQIRYKGQRGEQHIMFFYDPSRNALELKSFTNPEEIFT